MKWCSSEGGRLAPRQASTQASAKGLRRSAGWLPLAFLALLAGIFAVPAAAQNYEAGVPVKFGDKTVYLQPSEQWSGVQVQAGTSLQSVAQGGGRIYPRRRIVLFPAQNGRTRSATELKALPGAQRVVRAFQNGGLPPIVETDEILVSFKSGVSADRARQLGLSVGASPAGSAGGASLFTVNTNTTAIEAANALAAKSEVEWAQPNFVWPKKGRFTPNDPLFVRADHLNNTGQNGGTVGADIKAPAAWDLTLGSANITIAVVDDGIDIDHEDLTGRIVAPRDVADDDSDPRPVDFPVFGWFSDHGTACAGLALASANNNLGGAGVAPNCKLMPIRLLSPTMTNADEAEAFRWAADNGADVISNSWGPPDNPSTPGQIAAQVLPPVVRTAIDYATTSGRGGRGCVVLFASGNGNENMDTDGYASYSRVIAVGSASNRDLKASYSDFGASLDIVAPGGDLTGLVTTDRTGPAGYNISGNYTLPADQFAGTSAACPVAAGVAALVLSRDPSLTSTQVQARLQNTADKIDTAGGAYDASGHSDRYGSGRVNALRALQATVPPVTFSISGKVALASGTGVGGVVVTATTFGATTVTAADGTYTLAGLPAGTSPVVPTDPAYLFTPLSRDVVLGPNATNVNFTAQPLATITLIDPPDNTVINTANYTMRATTANNAIVQRVDFERSGSPVTFDRTPSLLIPDASAATPGVATDQLVVDTPGTVSAITANVSLSHPSVQDLVVTLIAPDGQRIPLYDHAAFGTLLNLSFSTTLNNPIAMNGVWSLEVSDTFTSPNDPVRDGTLLSWSLEFTPWVKIGSATAPNAQGEWTTNWPISQTPPGIYRARAVAITSGPAQQDINTNIVIPEPGITLITPPSDSTINAPTSLTAQGSNTGVIQKVEFWRRSAAAKYERGTDAAPLNISLLDRTTVSDEMSVPGGGMAEQATLHIKLQHDYVGDLKITLVLPNGTRVPVFYDPTSNDAEFDRDFVISEMAGQPFAGKYRLEIEDTAIPDTGTLLSWSMTFRLPWGILGSDTTPDDTGLYTLAFNPVSLPGGVYDFKAVAVTARGKIEDVHTNVTVVSNTKPTYFIGGVITKNGTPLRGVTVTRTGSTAPTATATTDAAGIYLFPAAPNGNYVVTPKLTSHSFSPLSRTVTLNGGDLTAINFTAIAGFNISGRVATPAGLPVTGVTLTRSGTAKANSPLTVTTDADGRYSFPGLEAKAYTITPSRSDATFTPTSKSVTITTASLTNVNFSAVTGYTISGRVTLDGAALANVRITRGGSTITTTTDVNGNYRMAAVPNGSYFIVAARDGYSFSPQSRSVTVNGAAVVGIDFAATRGVTVSGRVLNTLGKVVPGVRIERTGNGQTVAMNTAADGSFSFANVLPGTYTLKPSGTGYAFTPVARTVTVSVTTLSGLNFTAVPDTTGPTVTVTQPMARTYTTLTAATGTASDTGSGVARVTGRLFRFAAGTTPAGYWAGGTTWTATAGAANEMPATGTTSWSVALPAQLNGRYKFRATATDAAGNKTFGGEITFTVDANGPAIVITAPQALTYGQFTYPRQAYGTASDSAGVSRVTMRLYRAANGSVPAGYWAGGTTWTTTAGVANEIVANGTKTWAVDMPSLLPSRYTARITATDGSGTSSSAEVTFTVGGAAVKSAALGLTLSGSQADVESSTVTLLLGTPLSGVDTGNFAVEVDGRDVTVEGVIYVAAGRVVLALPEGSLRSGSAVSVAWADLTTPRGVGIAPGSVQLTAK